MLSVHITSTFISAGRFHEASITMLSSGPNSERTNAHHVPRQLCETNPLTRQQFSKAGTCKQNYPGVSSRLGLYLYHAGTFITVCSSVMHAQRVASPFPASGFF